MHSIKALVHSIVLDGRDQPVYAVASAVDAPQVKGSVTFSLKEGEQVWSETTLPEVGMFVKLSNLRSMRGGWRALSGKPWGLSD
jgi:hypothetical protein